MVEKIMNYLGILLFFVALQLHAQELFLSAQEAYQHGDYGAAYSRYSKIDKKSAAVIYNMGNCAYKMGKLQEAGALWHVALKKEPSYTVAHATTYNIGHVSASLEKKPGNYLSIGFFWYLISCRMMQLFFIIVWSMLWFLIVKRYSKAALIVSGLLILSGLGVVAKYYEATTSWALVASTPMTIYAGPDQTYHTVGIVKEPQALKINEQQGTWVKISADSGEGWLDESALVKL